MHARFLPSVLLIALLSPLSRVLASSYDYQQTPLNNPAGMPEERTQESYPDGDGFAGTLMLTDILTLQSAASIFFSYARETRLAERLARADERSTVLAPTNKAVMALARKPHQGPTPVEDGVILTEEEFDSRSKKNVENWVSAHIIPQSPIVLSPTSQFETLLPGCTVTVGAASERFSDDGPEWVQVVLNGNVTVLSRHEAANGVLYLIDGAIYG